MKSLWYKVLLFIMSVSAMAAVNDDFSDSVLDTSKWIPLDKARATVTETAGTLSFSTTDGTRAYVATVDSWDPVTQGTLTVTSTIYIPEGAGMVVWTRSNGDYDSDEMPSYGGVIGSGIRFSFANNEYDVGIRYKNDAEWPWLDVDGYSEDIDNLSVVDGDWNFTVIDTGSQVSLEIVNVADPTNYAIATGNTTYVPTVTSHKVVFGVSEGELKNVNIEVVGGDEMEDCGEWGYQVGDLNEDCEVNLLDFVILSNQWLQNTLYKVNM
ncbi:MAG: hypothetical protein JEZ07_17250 [Phycisphaerae bacterium]|nr:hypothetical protein [Phycisphaerae bacterium]